MEVMMLLKLLEVPVAVAVVVVAAVEVVDMATLAVVLHSQRTMDTVPRIVQALKTVTGMTVTVVLLLQMQPLPVGVEERPHRLILPRERDTALWVVVEPVVAAAMVAPEVLEDHRHHLPDDTKSYRSLHGFHSLLTH